MDVAEMDSKRARSYGTWKRTRYFWTFSGRHIVSFGVYRLIFINWLVYLNQTPWSLRNNTPFPRLFRLLIYNAIQLEHCIKCFLKKYKNKKKKMKKLFRFVSYCDFRVFFKQYFHENEAGLYKSLCIKDLTVSKNSCKNQTKKGIKLKFSEQ